MGTELTIGLVARTADFFGAPLIIVTGHAGTDWVALRSIKEALSFIGRRGWDGLVDDLRSEDLTVRHEGRTETLRFVERRAFFGLAINHERFAAFKQAVLDLVEAKQDGEVFQVDPRLKADPLLRNIINTFELAQQVALANLAASEAKQIAEDASRKASLALEGVHTRGERMALVAWCKWRKLKNLGSALEMPQAGIEGKWLTRYSHNVLGDDPGLEQVADGAIGGINTYLHVALLAWEEERLPILRSYMFLPGRPRFQGGRYAGRPIPVPLDAQYAEGSNR